MSATQATPAEPRDVAVFSCQGLLSYRCIGKAKSIPPHKMEAASLALFKQDARRKVCFTDLLSGAHLANKH